MKYEKICYADSNIINGILFYYGIEDTIINIPNQYITDYGIEMFNAREQVHIFNDTTINAYGLSGGVWYKLTGEQK